MMLQVIEFLLMLFNAIKSNICHLKKSLITSK